MRRLGAEPRPDPAVNPMSSPAKRRLASAALVVLIILGADAAPPVISPLPAPVRDGHLPVETALAQRRSIREYRDEPLPLAAVAQLMWAAQGLSHPEGFRTAPSAGALYPLEVIAVVGRVDGLTPGVYRYRPASHSLVLVGEGDQRRAVAAAALGQDWMEQAPLIVVLSACYERTTRKYGARGIRYAHLEAGHAAQNLCLQAVALRLGTAVVGAFDDAVLQVRLGLAEDEQPLSLIPVGRPR